MATRGYRGIFESKQSIKEKAESKWVYRVIDDETGDTYDTYDLDDAIEYAEEYVCRDVLKAKINSYGDIVNATIVWRNKAYDGGDKIFDESYEVVTNKFGEKIRKYNHPSKEDAEQILDLIEEEHRGISVIIDNKNLDVDYGNSKSRYDIYCGTTSTLFYHKSKEEAIDILCNIDEKLKEDEDEEKQYAKEALPKLWRYYKEGEWRDGQYISDFFSDYYKDVFHHRPRSSYQIESEIQIYADELGVDLT